MVTTAAAAHVAGWASTQGRRSSWALAATGSAGSPPIAGPNDPIGLRVELYMGGQGWVDISDHVYYRDRIRIQRGRSNETSQVPPQTCALTLNNRGGTFTPRNATGPYYGLIGRNTPIRVSRTWNGQRFYRYAGEVPAWPTTSDISGHDVYEQITASGVLRRLVQGNAPLSSPMFRAMTSGLTSYLVTAYWSCEDGPDATQFASGLSGGTPMTIMGSPQLAQNSDFACSASLPAVNESSWSAPVPLTANTTANVLRFLMSVPPGGDPNAADICRMLTAGTVARMEFAYATNGEVQVAGWDISGNLLFGTTSSFSLNGNPARLSMELIQMGSNITWALVMLTPGASAGTVISGSIAGTVGQATNIVINPHISTAPLGLSTTAVGHVSYQPTWDSLFDLYGPLNAWVGEPPDAVQTADGLYNTSRFTRLCLEQNINPVVVVSAAGYDVDPGPAAPVGMGVQTIDTLPTLLQQVPDTTAGLMFEPRDQVGLAMRTRASLYNQPAKLTLDYSQHQLAGPLNPVDDDQQVRNDIIVQRVNGSSATAVQTTGPLSIQEPPNGVGDYQTQYQLSLASDALLADAAGWRLLLGTVDQPRYPQISLNLRHPTFTGNVNMMNAALTLDIGDRIVIVNPPPELPPDPISLIVQGYSETLGIYEHDMVITCSPESPYEVGVLDNPVLGRADTDGSTLALAYPLGTETTIQVTTTNPASPQWTTSGADFPFDVMVAGERMTVTNIGAPALAATGTDGTFETGVTGWTVSQGTFVQSSAAAHSGTHSGLLTANSLLNAFIKTAPFPVTASAAYTLSGWMMLAAGAPSALLVLIQWYDASGSFISQAVPPGNAPTASWTQQSTNTAAPANAVTAVIEVVLDVTTASDAVYIDDLTLAQTTGGTQPFTVTRSVNNVVKPQTAGADVRLAQPTILSL